MTQPSISVAIATYNEESNINRCLQAVIDWVDEIVIYDASSTDNTISLIKKFKSRKIKLLTGPNHLIFHHNKQSAINACTSDWILQLDADEIVDRPLSHEIRQTITNTKFDGFWIKRKNYFLGTFLTKGGVYPDPTIRLYRRGKGRLPCKDVHEQAEIDGQVAWLENDLLHFADPNFSRYIMRNDRYTTILATQIKNPTFIDYFFIKPIITFISIFFRHRGYVDGFPGFVFAFYSALRFQSAYIKYWEKQHAKDSY